MRAAAALALLAFGAAAPPAAADTKSADKAFRKGKKLLEEKNYAEACAAFEESFREDPAIGAQLNVARCYEEWGKLTAAYDAYEEALALARSTKDARASQIKDLMKEIEQKIPTLVLSLPKGRLPPPGLVITLDGEDLPSAELDKPKRVDPGPHVIVIRAGKGEPQTTDITIAAGKRLPVELPIDALGAAEQEQEKVPEVVVEPAPAPSPGRNRRIAALAIGGAGVVGLGVATWLGLDARSDYNDAFAAGCDSTTNRCSEASLAATRDARSQANAATVVGSIALAAVATGAVLYLTAPKAERKESGDEKRDAPPQQARYLQPVLWPGGAGLTFGGEL